ncbi:beta-propeller domain-containing protein [Diplocloster modestus]|uniref:Beta-propeller domain-containing protein n=1 Tax=Diplocloster modestus TaxID=2850322 RepID=A0ABS6K960_9FIRM|nr:beta-propeller domain-containing protein [Diplocloster modestus]MBU9727049.1 beta-propeller domain-containing protein [Diplocloster modestus]
MDEKKMLEQIRRAAEDVEIPAHLRPEAVDNIINSTSKGKKVHRHIYQYGMAAAACLVVVAAVWLGGNTQKSGPESAQMARDATSAGAAAPAAAADSAAGSKADAKAVDSPIPTPDSYEDLYEKVLNAKKQQVQQVKEAASDLGMDYDGAAGAADGMAGGAEESAVQGAAKYEAAANVQDDRGFSTTNLQVRAVDEGDIIKNDGQYLYIADTLDNTFQIVRADGSQMTKTAELSMTQKMDSIYEFYVTGDTLTIIGSSSQASLEQNTSDDVYRTVLSNQTIAVTYDIRDRSMPSEIGSVTQDGYYETSRRNGNYLYLFTNYYKDELPAYPAQYDGYIPAVNGKLLTADCIYLPEYIQDSSYLVVSGIDLRKPGQISDAKTVVTNGQHYYASTENIYIAEAQGYGYDTNKTEILKLNYANGQITPSAVGVIRGNLNNSFSMDEYKGNLRIVTTAYDSKAMNSTNELYVLDENLETIGEIKGLAKGEQIYSARFFGDTGYFVTYRETDPLFSVDLSDPENPKVMGELKVTGFSNYLHFYSDHLLLGLGEETDPKTGNHLGLKLSMFDISDPENVVEVHKYVLQDYNYADAWYNYKEMLIDPEKNIFGFAGYGNRKGDSVIDYLVFSYDPEKGFINRLVYSEEENESGKLRGAYIGNTFYVIQPFGETSIASFNMGDKFTKSGTYSQ